MINTVGIAYNKEEDEPFQFINFYIKSRMLRWAGHVARMEEGRSALNILTCTPVEKRPLGRSRLDGRTILEWILKK